MRVIFWGVRGSLPSPQLPIQIKSKISAILERLRPEDIESPESRERFLADLPPWLFGTVGGNSPCVSVNLGSNDELIVFDAGSGLRELGAASTKETQKFVKYHFFFSHFHWDHIMGLPFFGPAYDPNVQLDFYSPMSVMEQALQGQMKPPYFPVQLESMASKKNFHTLSAPIKLPGAAVSYRKMNHPGGSYSYKVEDGKHKLIYSTDSELSANDFIRNDENTAFFSDADLLIMDAQYTLGEAIEKYNWGHSAFSLAVDFVANWNIKHMVLFHHDPASDDHKLHNILQSANLYIERINKKSIKLSLAVEGMEINL
jgi:phosphoribosyl 1,2-cyclic phosphodiesterase